MSHVTDIKTEIKDLDALAIAAEKLGLELVRDQKTYKWYGKFIGDAPLPEGMTEEDLGQCEHALRVKGRPNAYEVGVIKAKNGKGYTLLFDYYAGGQGLMKHIGDNAGKLTQRYAAEAAIKQARRQGFQCRETVGTDGKIRIIARR